MGVVVTMKPQVRRIQRSTLLIAAFLLFPLMAVSQPPSTFSYQAYLTDSTGVPIDGAVSIRFALYPADIGGIVLWNEIQTVSVDKGLLNVELGQLVPLDLSDFNDSLYLGITVESDPEMQPRRPLLVTPYSFRTIIPSCIPGDFVGCYTGPSGSADVSKCQGGVRTCTADGVYGERCEGEVLPQPEICDGRDNNCNGEADEGDVCVERCFSNSDCRGGKYCKKDIGDCNGEGICTVAPNSCPGDQDHVCGCGGQTMSNACQAAQAKINIKFFGRCL